MKIIKNIHRRRKEKQKARIELKIKKEYDLKMDHLAEVNQTAIRELKSANQNEIQKIHDFYKSEFDIVESKIEDKYKNMIQIRDNRIQELENYINENREVFKYLKEREQELENVINLFGTKFKGFYELVTNGYQSIDNSYSKLDQYNRKHIKKDTKVIEAINKE